MTEKSPGRGPAASKPSPEDGPREWSYQDLNARTELPARALRRARTELGYESPLTARQIYRLIERTYQISGAYYARRLPK